MRAISSLGFFSVEGWGGGDRKANFIFLTINLVFSVLFHFYNYSLDFGTCVKLAVQIVRRVEVVQLVAGQGRE